MNEHNDRESYLIDSNVFLRVIVRDDERTWQDCGSFLTAVGNSQINAYIPSLIPAEVHYVLKSFYGYKRIALLESLKSIAAIANIRIFDDISFYRAVELFEEYNVKFIDCLLASSKLIQEGKAVIVSYDRDFDKLGIRRVEPGGLLKKSPKE